MSVITVTDDPIFKQENKTRSAVPSDTSLRRVQEAGLYTSGIAWLRVLGGLGLAVGGATGTTSSVAKSTIHGNPCLDAYVQRLLDRHTQGMREARRLKRENG